jgi:single-strand DNA-binding protein
MINKVILIGNIGSPPEIKISSKNTKFAKIALATHQKYTSKDGTTSEKTQWHNVVVFDPILADRVEKYYTKGKMAYIEGQLETRKYEHQGVTKYITEVVVPKFNGNIMLLSSKDAKPDTTAPAPVDDDEPIPF